MYKISKDYDQLFSFVFSSCFKIMCFINCVVNTEINDITNKEFLWLESDSNSVKFKTRNINFHELYFSNKEVFEIKNEFIKVCNEFNLQFVVPSRMKNIIFEILWLNV